MAALEEVVLFLGDFTGVDKILELSENSRYKFSPPPSEGRGAPWLGSRRDGEPDGPVLSLRFGHDIYSPEGWVCGSAADTDRADVQIAADNKGGVSRRHIRVDINPLSCKPRLTVLGQLLRLITPDSIRIVRIRDQSVDVDEPLVVELGTVKFRIWQPLLTPAQRSTYRQRVKQFSRDAVAAIPRHLPSLDSSAPTVSSAIRVGRDGAVYSSLKDVGKGMSATVMLVERQNTREGPFVAKEPYFKITDGSGAIQGKWEEVKQEFEQLARLHHPHVVETYDVASSQDKSEPPWLIMEYIPDALDPRKLDETRVRIVATQILSALAHIHANDIVHGDVKPANILVRYDDDLTVKLADFGLAQHYVRDNLHTLKGTPFYWAPELRELKIRYSNMADMFSFGLVLLECVSDFDPLSDMQAHRILDAADHSAWMGKSIVPIVQEQAPQFWRPLLRGLLRRDPEKRWSALRCLTWLAVATKSIGTSGLPNMPPSSCSEIAVDKRNLSLQPFATTAHVSVEVAGSAGHVGSQTAAASPARPTSPSEAPTPGPDDAFDDARTEEPADGEESGFCEDWKVGIQE